jgi:hypothetical protein
MAQAPVTGPGATLVLAKLEDGQRWIDMMPAAETLSVDRGGPARTRTPNPLQPPSLARAMEAASPTSLFAMKASTSSLWTGRAQSGTVRVPRSRKKASMSLTAR